MSKKKKKTNSGLKLFFVLGVAAILLVAIVVVILLEYFIVLSGIASKDSLEGGWVYGIFVFGVVSIVIGIGLALILGRIIYNPFDKLINGLSKLHDGDFSIRLDIDSRIEQLQNLTESFNALAKELENTEILRSDFVNNFSHELKTPIASVLSLISLLKNERLSKDKREKYLSVIEEEMDRLASMTTNILNLSKVENQGILTGEKEFNVSEQIRNCILLLERKWTKKNLDLSLDFDEFNVVANEDMLKQVWFNLLDNAIKFANDNGSLRVDIVQEDEKINVRIENSGSYIKESEYDNIFNKFYRLEDDSHKEGNGIGLSIVKHIVQLHGGSVKVESKENKTAFTVLLPK